MAAPKQARRAGTSARAAGSGTKARDKGTRGGRPEPPAATPGRRGGQAGNGQRAGRAGRGERAKPGSEWASRPARAAAPVPAKPAEDGARSVPLWLWLSTLVLSLIGLADSVYLTIAHYTTASVLACSDRGIVNCAAVTTSPESVVFGIFPVAVLGLAFYVFLVGINTPWAWRARWPAIGWARAASLIVGIGFVLYLVYTEVFTLGEICLYCTYVHVITFVLFALTMFAVAAGYGISRSRAH